MSYKRPKKIKKIKTSQSQTVGVKMPLSVVHLIWNHPIAVQYHITYVFLLSLYAKMIVLFSLF
jgi:hypothetical protein